MPTPLVVAGLPHLPVHLAIKDESHHPSGTFKDRLLSAAVESIDPPATIATISYGSTALSLAQHLTKERYPGLRGFVVLPHDIERRVYGPSTSGRTLNGADLLARVSATAITARLPEDGTILTEQDVLDQAKHHGASDVDILDITEGLESPVYSDIASEAIDQLGSLPDVCVVPFGAGILANQVRDVFANTHTVVVPISAPSRDSMAAMLYGPMWVDVQAMSRQGVGKSRHSSPDRTGAAREPYDVYAVTEPEIMLGLSRMRRLGISAEPSAAASIGVLDRLPSLARSVRSIRTVLIISTGNSIDAFHHPNAHAPDRSHNSRP
jgi:hypothetical protein